MTRRITISLPDDVAAYVEQNGSKTSPFIAGVLRRRMLADALRELWADRGHVITDEAVERTRARLAERAPISDEQHDRNLTWLAGVEDGSGPA